MSISVFQLRQQVLEALAQAEHLQNLLLLLQFQRQVGGDRVGQATRVVDASDRGEDLGRDLLVQLHVLVELGDDRPPQRLQFGADVLLGATGVSSQVKWVCSSEIA